MEKKTSARTTFVVQIQFVQNSSWQGTVAWTEQKKEQRFRSTLELIKLMDEALEAERGDKAETSWD